MGTPTDTVTIAANTGIPFGVHIEGLPVTFPVDINVNPKDAIGYKKPPIDLVPPVLEILTSLAFRDGAKKYGPFNWRERKVKWSVYYAAAKRHLASAFDGEDIDPISGVPHLAHLVACIAILMDAETTGCLIDDRPTKGGSSEVIEKYTIKD